MLYLTLVIAFATLAQGFFAWRLYKLQRAIENARNICLLYVRVKLVVGQPLVLQISNLSDYDVWVEEVRLFVTRSASQPGNQVVGGDFRLSRGQSEAGVAIQPGLIVQNGNVQNQIDADFYVDVRVWARDKTETRKSPTYNIQWGPAHAASLNVIQ